ncbi:hypothetical protein Tco_1257784 [Tanacetum coccineum]
MDRDSNNNCYGNAEIRHGVKPTLSPNLNTLALVVVIHQSLQLCLLTAKVRSMKRQLDCCSDDIFSTVDMLVSGKGSEDYDQTEDYEDYVEARDDV